MQQCMFNSKNPNALWGKIANMQEQDRKHEEEAKRAQEKQEKAAAQGSGGFGVKHRLSPGEVWRATDFWREGLLQQTSNDIKNYNSQKLSIHASNYQKITKAKQEQKLPAEFFVDVTGWLWSVKEDGYLVKLIRDENNKWSMRTRKDTLLHPPAAFLQGLEQNEELPSFMVGELVTNFTGCDEDARNDKDKRNKKRNEQFGKLHKVFEGEEEVWDGLRIKIFSFPHSSMDLTDTHSMRSIQETYKHYSTIMQKTLQYHPHIGMCRFGKLKNTQDAIDIFNIVVQLGLEGIVIVHPDVQYGALTDPHTDDNAKGKLFFKLKQKIVLNDRQIMYLGPIKRKKDGKMENEYEYQIKDDKDKDVKFIDQQGRKDKSYSRIKYMEYVPGDYKDEGFKGFPCRQGYRHMHFATDNDESVQVPALSTFQIAPDAQKVLAWDQTRNRILNWDQLQDPKSLNSSLKYRLFNPKPFALEASETCSPPSSEHRLLKRSKSGVFKKFEDWRKSDSEEDVIVIHDDDDATQYHAGAPVRQTPYDVEHSATADSGSEPWPAPNANDSEWVQLQWRLRSKPREKDPETIRRAYDQAILNDLRREEKRQLRLIEKERVSKQTDKQASNMYYIISSFRNI